MVSFRLSGINLKKNIWLKFNFIIMNLSVSVKWDLVLKLKKFIYGYSSLYKLIWTKNWNY